MRGLGAACSFVLCSLIGLQLAAAQAPNPPPMGVPEATRMADSGQGAVLVVMESAGGIRAASSLRTALGARGGVRVMALADVARAKVQPTVILTVSAVASREVSVAYWDLAGSRDALAAPAPARADQLDAVVLALASALLEKHRPELSARAKGVAEPMAQRQLSRTTDALYAVLGRYGRMSPRTNVALRFEDF